MPPVTLLVRPLEGIALLTPLDELVNDLDKRGWRHNAQTLQVADQQVTIFPTSGAERIDLIIEDLLVIGITASYRDSNYARRDAHARLSLHREGPDGWYAGDRAHHVIAFVSRDGKQVRLIATGRMRDQRGVATMFRVFLNDPP